MAKVVFLTGSASGLGLHLTERFIKSGHKVVATDVNFSGLKAIAAEKQWPKDRVWVRKLDVTQKSQWKKLWIDVIEKWGGVDVLINIAGYLKPGYAHETDIEEVDRHLNINVKGLIYGCQFAANTMVEQGHGHIINIASLAGLAPVPGISLYSGSKFAVRGFSLALAQELKSKHVAVTVICPDAIETPMLQLQEDFDEAALTFSGNKVLTVEEVGQVIFEKVLLTRPLEIFLPLHRGLLAKLSSAIPSLSFHLAEYLKKNGRTEQAKRLAKRT